ncbi:long-chain-fatty-acid--CoA ligase [Hellea balneolensis]|uniref:long-chain-fatty-acid--CoA ligase n=1 Tax=Hellea balneolensis TaxID=287478 RepID=UPI00042030FF|nr:long-chain-fatty-acid--CoA ligase [Hellea balneolensis]
MPQAYDDLPKTGANFVPLTPLSFLERTADIYPDREALVYNDRRYNWQQVRARCRRVASGLNKRGIGMNDTVSVLAYNTPEMFELQFAVGMAGAVLNTINTRLDAATIAYIIDHAETKLFILDRELWPVVSDALEQCHVSPELVFIDDSSAAVKPNLPDDVVTYEDLIAQGDPDYRGETLADEWQAFSLNYTSGTTGRPKGVVYHHRGAYLMAMGTVPSWGLPQHPQYLYIVPMFHCNGWGHAWTMTLLAGTTICLRAITPKAVFDLIEQHDVTHFGGAPIVLNMLANTPDEEKPKLERPIQVMTAGAPPPASVLEAMANMNFNVLHVYGLTETYGHVLQAAPQSAWNERSIKEQSELKSRQGVRFANTEAADVLDEEGNSVPHDGKTMGEIVIRSNVVMKGYLKDKAATAEAFKDDWFVSGDLGVIYPDGYIQLRDRAKDIIISGGENISSVEVENTLYKHPAVDVAAVVAMPDQKWGEVPCAFVELKSEATEAELIDFCGDNMARFKRPKKVVFGELPKTATGKIQKKELRDRALKL